MQDNKKMLDSASTFPEIWASATRLEKASIRADIIRQLGVSGTSIWRWGASKGIPISAYMRNVVCQVCSHVMKVEFDPLTMFKYVQKED